MTRVVLISPPRRLSRLLVILCLGLLLLAANLTFEPSAAKNKRAEKGVSSRAVERATWAATVAQAVPAPDPNPSVSGRWDLLNGQVKTRHWGTILSSSGNRVTVPIHISVLPDGRLLFWGRDKFSDSATDSRDVTASALAYTWNPLYDEAPDAFLPVHNNRTNLFCSGHSFLQDGRLLVTGGQGIGAPGTVSIDGEGSNHINIFDYRTNTWSAGPNMRQGRWYPFNVTLPNGEVLIMRGSFKTSSGGASLNNDIEFFTPNGLLRRSVTLDNGLAFTQTYPQLHVLPNGRVFRAITLGGTDSQVFDPVDARFLKFPELHIDFEGEGAALGWDVTSSIQYEQGKFIMMGGRSAAGSEAQNHAVTIDLPPSASGTVKWKPVASLNVPRMHHNATLLPDGKVLITGGTRCRGTNNVTTPAEFVNGQEVHPACTGGVVREPELWDPAQPNQWRVMSPASATPRVYHSVAILLPDARVLLGGGGRPTAVGEKGAHSAPEPGGGHADVEIYSPPYLFDANNNPVLNQRPAITSAPERVAYGQTFDIGVARNNVASGEHIGKVVLVRLPSVTHQFGQDQRRVELTIDGNARTEHSLRLTAPSDRAVCPPGPYMMFALTRNGSNWVPSVARIITVSDIALQPSSASFVPWNPDTNTGPSQSGTVSVIAPDNTPWDATVTAGGDWLSLTGGQSGTGSNNVTYSVARNDSQTSRIGTIRVGLTGKSLVYQEFNVFQARKFDDVTVAAGGFPLFISIINSRGIAAGTSATEFSPGSFLTREQMAVMIIRGLGAFPKPIPANVDSPFTDVERTHWAAPFIREMKLREITSGCFTPSGIGYCPGDNVTRLMMAVFVIRALGIDPPPATGQFWDVPASMPEARYVEEAARRNITAGCGGGGFCPGDFITREQTAVFISKTFGLQ